jgi:uncharacterized phage-associated protein
MYLYTGPQDARAVANYFLHLARKEGRSIDPMGIQKLVYFAHGWNLAMYGRPLISQPVEAWDYGPVIRDLYQDFKRFGNGPIKELAMELNVEPGTMRLQFTKPDIAQTNVPPETLSLLGRVWEVYKPFSSVQLSNMTHAIGSPWKTARDRGMGVIPNELIKQWFTTQMNAPR